MVSIIPTPSQAYKGFWYSPGQDQFMDPGKPERSSPRQSNSLTDPTSYQSLLPVNFSAPAPRPLQLKLPETKGSRKRKASEVEGLTMPQSTYPRQMEDLSNPQTINPQNLTTSSASSTQAQYSTYTSLPMTSSSYGWQQQPQSFARRVSAPAQSPYPYDNSMSTWMQGSSPGTSRTPSIASTGSQSMSAEQMYSMQSAYGGMGYTPQPAFANPNQYNL